MTDKQIENQISSIKKVTKDLIAGGPDVCRKFLVDAGILKKRKKHSK